MAGFDRSSCRVLRSLRVSQARAGELPASSRPWSGWTRAKGGTRRPLAKRRRGGGTMNAFLSPIRNPGFLDAETGSSSFRHSPPNPPPSPSAGKCINSWPPGLPGYRGRVPGIRGGRSSVGAFLRLCPGLRAGVHPVRSSELSAEVEVIAAFWNSGRACFPRQDWRRRNSQIYRSSARQLRILL